MNIIIYVDFSSKEFNKDFNISNALLDEHTVLLVTSREQLEKSYKNYDILLFGNSISTIPTIDYINSYSIKDKTLEEIKKRLQ